ncbi:MAG: ribbon-helix-helix protein, CopG family, partial [Candidatus Dormibacter sp.]
PSQRPTDHATIGSMARPKLSITVDPDLLKVVDAYVAVHDGLDRSKVIEQALEFWTAAQQDSEMEQQFAAEDALAGELASWRSIRRSAASARLGRR